MQFTEEIFCVEQKDWSADNKRENWLNLAQEGVSILGHVKFHAPEGKKNDANCLVKLIELQTYVHTRLAGPITYKQVNYGADQHQKAIKFL